MTTTKEVLCRGVMGAPACMWNERINSCDVEQARSALGVLTRVCCLCTGQTLTLSECYS
jgi:hypothetical protein